MNRSGEPHFVFEKGRLFFNVSSFPELLGVRRGRVAGAAMDYMAQLPKEQRFDHVVSLGCSVPAYLDKDAFINVLDRLNDAGEQWHLENGKGIVSVLETEFPVLFSGAEEC